MLSLKCTLLSRSKTFVIGLNSNFLLRAKSRKYRRVFKVKSREKTLQVRENWSQQLQIPYFCKGLIIGMGLICFLFFCFTYFKTTKLQIRCILFFTWLRNMYVYYNTNMPNIFFKENEPKETKTAAPLTSGGFRGGGGDVRPPPLKSAKKEKVF